MVDFLAPIQQTFRTWPAITGRAHSTVWLVHGPTGIHVRSHADQERSRETVLSLPMAITDTHAHRCYKPVVAILKLVRLIASCHSIQIGRFARLHVVLGRRFGLGTF